MLLIDNGLRFALLVHYIVTQTSLEAVATGQKLIGWIYSTTCLKQAVKGNTKIACLRQVLA